MEARLKNLGYYSVQGRWPEIQIRFQYFAEGKLGFAKLAEFYSIFDHLQSRYVFHSGVHYLFGLYLRSCLHETKIHLQ